MNEESKELARQARNEYQRQYTKRFPEKKKTINHNYWLNKAKKSNEKPQEAI